MGFFNHYSGLSLKNGAIYVHQTGASIPIDRTFFKDAFAVTKFNSYIIGLRLRRYLRRRPYAGSLAFYPQPSGPWYNAWLMARIGGLKISPNIETADHIFIFDDSTHSHVGEDLPAHLRAKAVNDRITDISKNNVANIFTDIFGYALKIDPLTYKGQAVKKSDANGTHDGVVINCPITKEAYQTDQAYQKLIDSTYNGTQSEDLRIIYILGEIAVVFHKWKDLDKRFGTDYARVDIEKAEDVFSSPEQELIFKFCEEIKLDYGAIDIMRDKHDGRIYIVDVNKTGMPVLCLSISEQARAFRLMAETFIRNTARRNEPNSARGAAR